MSVVEQIPAGFRTAFIVTAFLSIFIGLIMRETSPTNRGFGMALIVVGALMMVIAAAGRYLNWW